MKPGFFVLAKSYLYILSLVFLGLNNVPAQTVASDKDTITTDVILVTANRIPISALLSPNKIQVIDESIVSRLNGSRLSDVLAYADGVFMKDYGFNSGLKGVSINATQNEHTLILLNGIKLNSSQNAQFDSDLLPADNISRVEISKGGASSLYGSDAIGGVINIITNDKSPGSPLSFDISNTIGSYSFEKLSLGAGSSVRLKGSSRIYLIGSFSYEKAMNDYVYSFYNGFTNSARYRANNNYQSNNFEFNSRYEVDKKSELDLYTLFNKADRGVPGPDFGYSVSEARQIDNNVISSLSYKRSLNESSEIKSNLGYQYSLMKYYDPATFSSVSPINSFYKLNTFFNSGEISLFKNSNNEVASGYEIDYNNIESNEIEKSKRTQIGIYVASKFILNKVIDRITVFPSARYDFYADLDKGVVTGKLGINIKPLRKLKLSFKSSVGNNFRAPTFNELYWIGLGNKNLHPERSISYDAGIYFDFRFLSNNIFEASYFDINTIDRIVWMPDNAGTWRPSNIGQTNSSGIDLSLKSSLRISKSFLTGISFSYNYAKSIKKNSDFPGDPTYGKQMIYIPQEYEKASISLDYSPDFKLLKLISINVFYNFTGKRFMDFENNSFVPYYGLIDANLNFSMDLLKTETSIKLSVNNITNENYAVILGYPMPLRNFKLQFAIKY